MDVGLGDDAGHHIDVVWRSSSSGPSVTAPTRIGRFEMASAPMTIWWLSTSRIGSMSVEFSGHRIMSGAPLPETRCSATAMIVWDR